MKVFLYHTERTIRIVAETEDEADRMVQAELHRDQNETVVSSEELEDEAG